MDLVLYADRNPVQGASVPALLYLLAGLPGLFHSLVGAYGDVGVDLGIDLLDAVQVGVQGLLRRYLPRLN